MAHQHKRHGSCLMPSLARHFQQCDWQPPADVYRIEGGWLIKYDLAGVRPEEVEIAVRGRQVVVRGRRRDALVERQQRSYLLEISYSTFERLIELPSEVETMTLLRDYRDGILIVRLMEEVSP